MSTINTERKPPINAPLQTKRSTGIVQSKEDWISKDLENNINHFNEMFIENLSQSLSSMLVLKKAKADVEMKTPNLKSDDINPLNDVHDNDGNNNNALDSDSDSNSDNENDAAALEIEQILPQGDKEVQEVINENEESRK